MPPKTRSKKITWYQLSIVVTKRSPGDLHSWILVLGEEGSTLNFKFWHITNTPGGYSVRYTEAPMDACFITHFFGAVHAVCRVPGTCINQLCIAVDRATEQNSRRWVTVLLLDLLNWQWVSRAKAERLQREIVPGRLEPRDGKESVQASYDSYASVEWEDCL